MAIELCKYGHFSERGTQNQCRECRRLYSINFRKNNPEKAKNSRLAYYATNREQRTADSRRYYRTNFKKTMLRNAQKRARVYGYMCTIAENDIVIPEFCPLLGIKIVPGSGRSDASPSIDKIIPALGYVPENIWVIS